MASTMAGLSDGAPQVCRQTTNPIKYRWRRLSQYFPQNGALEMFTVRFCQVCVRFKFLLLPVPQLADQREKIHSFWWR